MAQAETVPVAQPGGQRGLPFTFAKQHSVLLDQSAGESVVVHQGRPSLEVLTELRRFLGEREWQ